ERGWSPQQPREPRPYGDPREGGAEVLELALGWGAVRGLGAPLFSSSSLHASPHSIIATAGYQVARDFVQVWFLSNGASLCAVTYTCPRALSYEEERERDEIVASLRIG